MPPPKGQVTVPKGQVTVTKPTGPPQRNFLGRRQTPTEIVQNRRLPNQTNIALLRQQQTQENQNGTTNIPADFADTLVNRILNNATQPQNVTQTPPQNVTEEETKPRRGNAKVTDSLARLRETRRQEANEETLQGLNAAGTHLDFLDMPDTALFGDDPLYANLKSVLADIERIRGGDYPEYIKNRMLSNAYDTAAQTAGVLDLGGIEDEAQSKVLNEIYKKASANAANAKQTLNPVRVKNLQREGASKGGINSVGIYNVPGAKDSQGESNERKFFKKENIVDEKYRNTKKAAIETELTNFMPHLGINVGKDDEKVDRHMRDREIGYSMLNDYLGAGVSVGAREAADESGNKGALLDEAKGMTPDEYGWNYLAPIDPEKTSKEEQEQALDLTDSIVKDENGVVDKTKTSKYGDRLKAAKKELVPTSYQVTKKGQDGKDLTDGEGNPIYAPTLDVFDPKLHRDMNRLQIMDSLTGHIDRHSDNFKIETDEEGKYKSLKAIDNDMSFGAKKRGFGERFHNSPGMGDGALIDKEMADRVKNVPRQDLDYLFRGMFSEDPEESKAVIENLWSNMQGFNEYAERNKKFQVEDWTKTHGMEELLTATGALFNASTKTQSHNTLYQRLMMTRLPNDPRLKASKGSKNVRRDEKGY